jgi:ribA/ribD-fused uncharacterized protein
MSGPEEKIVAFSDEYRFLSNFHAASVEFGRIMFPTVEHAYQAAKSSDYHERKMIASLSSPGRPKEAGAKLSPRAGWDAMRLSIMEELLRQKFTRHPDLHAKLLATSNAILEEGNTWGDTFWGICDGSGENHLGKLLMKIRAELREQQHAGG